jgi:hypothetical protein
MSDPLLDSDYLAECAETFTTIQLEDDPYYVDTDSLPEEQVKLIKEAFIVFYTELIAKFNLRSQLEDDTEDGDDD